MVEFDLLMYMSEFRLYEFRRFDYRKLEVVSRLGAQQSAFNL